jgi:hypothetical protein
VFRYSVYGLELASDTVLPELTSLAAPEEAVVQIKVRLQLDGRRDPGVPRWILHSALPNGDDWALYGKIEGGYLLRYVGLADFIVECRGHELTCARIEPGTSPQTLRHLLLDQVLPLVLNLLRCDVLHASAVATPAGICAFIGPAGAGKSTLAASFAAAGYTIFCDDCLVLWRIGEIACLPGYPGVRLWSDSSAALGYWGIEPSEVADYTAKRRIVGHAGRFTGSPRPLIAIYRISRPIDPDQVLTTVRIEPLTGRAAFMELVSSAFVLDVSEPATLLRHFRCIEQLVSQIPVAHLMLLDDFALLPAARHAILSDLGTA